MLRIFPGPTTPTLGVMKRTFCAWASTPEEPPHSLLEGDVQPRDAAGNVLAGCEQLLFRVEACSWEEAMAIYYLRQGWAPFVPEGPAEICPKCAALFYPRGSGQCWNCDHEC